MASLPTSLRLRYLLAAALSTPVLLSGCGHTTAVVYAPPPPPAWSTVQQQGFHDGFEAARHDVANSVPPSFERHPRFRNPPVPPPAWHEYREGFRAGYERFLHPEGPRGF